MVYWEKTSFSGIRYCLQKDNWLLWERKGNNTIIARIRSESLDLLSAVDVSRVLCIIQSFSLYITLDSHCDTQSLTFHVLILIDDY
jgi:hypothetical protein